MSQQTTTATSSPRFGGIAYHPVALNKRNRLQLSPALQVALLATLLFSVFALCADTPAFAQPDPVQKRTIELQVELSAAASGGNFFKARAAAERVHQYLRKARGTEHIDTLRAKQMAAGYFGLTGNHRVAERYYRELIGSYERTKGRTSNETASALDALASTLWGRQRLDEAEKLFARSLSIYRKNHGVNSVMFAAMLVRQAAYLQARYMFSAAEQLYRQAGTIYKKQDPDGTMALNIDLSLGQLFGRQGEFTKARKAFEHLIAGYEKKYGKTDTTYLPAMLQSVGMMYSQWGRLKLSKKSYDRAEAGFRRRLDELRADPKAIPALIEGVEYQLASLFQRTGQRAKAIKAYEKIRKAKEKEHGVGSYFASYTLYALADLYKQAGQFDKARAAMMPVLATYKKSLGGFSAVTPLSFLADIERRDGKFVAAKKYATRLHRAAAGYYGKSHPLTGMYSETIALAELGLGNANRALSILSASYRLEKKAIAMVLAAGTESDNRAFLSERRHKMHVAISLHSQYLPTNTKALRLGLDTTLVYKGRLLDASAASISGLRKRLSPKDRKVLDELSAARAELSQLVLAGPASVGSAEYAREVARLESAVRKLETTVRSRSSVFRAREQPIELAKIQKRIPREAALIEIVSYRRIDLRGANVVPRTGDRYGAYIIGRRGDPNFVDLGPTKRIDQLVDAFRGELSTSQSTDFVELGKRLYRMTFKKIEAKLGTKTLALLAPDGGLNLLPFAALVDENDRFLVERFRFSYLTSGRDLLRLAVSVKPKAGPMIFADPSFDESGKTKAGTKKRGLTVRALRSTKWQRLPGTAEEADQIIKLLPGAVIHRGSKATESRLKKVTAPSVLHLATHGFFLSSTTDRSAFEQKATPKPSPAMSMLPPIESLGSGQDHPLLRSGLVLAGANKLRSGADDGVLTALEASSLDLWGTKLVVLSACETGVGKVSQGDGVYGLRRALVIAGAESLLMSLWQVDDEATRDLMTGYYKRLKQGKGRAEALRLIQLRMLNNKQLAHPYYWASFIPSGAWTPMKASSRQGTGNR